MQKEITIVQQTIWGCIIGYDQIERVQIQIMEAMIVEVYLIVRQVVIE